jgi:hypothetical protein
VCFYVLYSHDHGVVIFHCELEAFLAKLEWIETDANGVAGAFVYVQTGKAELLEALRSALQIEDHANGACAEFTSNIRMAKASIAKAEGRK